MKRVVTASLLACVGAYAACSSPEQPAPIDTGSGGTGVIMGGAGPQGGMGNVGQGGSVMGGTGPVGGSAGVGMGGTPAMGGSAGDTTMGGSAGSGNVGGMSGGDAGSGNVGGQTGGSGGQTGGSGGQTGGSGGMPGGSGGMPGGTGGSAGAACPSITELFPVAQVTGQATGLTGTANPAGAMGSLEGHLITTPCADTTCDDCSGGGWIYKGTLTGCNAAGSGLNAIQNFKVGGVPGQNYRVTLHFYGVTEPKDYGTGITREAGTQRPNQADTGSTPPPFAYAVGNPTYRGSDYNTYEIHVVDNNGMEECSYFLNSDTSGSEGHWTYLLNYERTINVVGGGVVRVRVYDRNCRMIKNCMADGQQGSCSASGCNNKARTISAVNQASPPPGTALVQPGLGNSDDQAGQWLYIDVTEVECSTQPPNTTCAPY